MDFTINKYLDIIQGFKNNQYHFLTFAEFMKNPKQNAIILRHDVDKLPLNSLRFAEIQNKMGIRGSYYFRVVKESFDRDIIKKIYDLGHEIGYHYETMDTCRGDIEKAFDEFCRNLKLFRQITPIETICMHGSPLSKFDNRAIWETHDYKLLGISGEPYFDINFDEVFYITDTGRRFNGTKYSVRDKPMNEISTIWPVYSHSDSVIESLQKRQFPEKTMFTFHPQRWTNNPVLWVKELLFQNSKNMIKKIMVSKQGKTRT